MGARTPEKYTEALVGLFGPSPKRVFIPHQTDPGIETPMRRLGYEVYPLTDFLSATDPPDAFHKRYDGQFSFVGRPSPGSEMDIASRCWECGPKTTALLMRLDWLSEPGNHLWHTSHRLRALVTPSDKSGLSWFVWTTDPNHDKGSHVFPV